MMLLGCFFFAFPPFMYPFVTGPISLLLLRFLHGFATANFSPVAAAYIADLAEEGRGVKLGWYASANDVGSTVGPLAGGTVLFYTASYSATYLLVGVLGVITLLALVFLPEPPAAEERSASVADTRWKKFRDGIMEVLSSPPVVIASGLEAVMYVGYGTFLGFIPIYAKAASLNDAQIGIVLGAQPATAMAAKPLAGWSSDRVGRKPVIIIGLLLCAGSLPVTFRGDSFQFLIISSALLGLGVASVTPSPRPLWRISSRRAAWGRPWASLARSGISANRRGPSSRDSSSPG
ncbi:MAG: MFS transporter [Nitrospinota bacterium]|jgi:MFS family permease|nr:MFS transporter [Nitrospinota bacterium]MDP7368922.1 MFS transporter [Nitrospinota bacterium]MDP7664876.1 MFS transporter [Nitrospinota bacterium]